MTRVTFQCRQYWPLVCTAAFLICCAMLLMDQTTVLVLEDIPETKKAAVHQNSLWVWSNHTKRRPPAPPPPRPATVPENFTCSVNGSRENISSDLPLAHQEFLRYKHCRSFPTLLTPSPCEDDLHLLLAIKSTAAQVERRAALRDTWGRAGRINGRRVKLVFLMGRSRDQVQNYNLQPLLEWENDRYGDILQWDFVDSFFNLTLKEVRFLSWFSRSCSSSEFVFKGDDDVFVHTENLLEFLEAHKPENHLITGDVIPKALPIRNKASKYFIPVEMYPDGKQYPPYAGGGGYLMSRQTVLELNEAAQRVPLFPIDDVYVGMCLEEMGKKPTHHSGFLTFGLGHGLKHFDPCVYRDIMLVHKLKPVEMWVMWALLQDQRSQCRGLVARRL